MTIAAVLGGVKALLSGTYARTYVWPDDSASVTPTPPFVVIEAMPGVPHTSGRLTFASDGEGFTVGVNVYTSRGYPQWGSPADATAKTTAYAAKATVEALIAADPTLGGTVYGRIGNEQYYYRTIVSPMAWNNSEMFGIYVEIPVEMEK